MRCLDKTTSLSEPDDRSPQIAKLVSWPQTKTTSCPEECDQSPVFENSPDLTTYGFTEKEDEYPLLILRYQTTNLLIIFLRIVANRQTNIALILARLSEPLKAFVHQLSAIDICTKVTEALKDPKWTQAMKEEMKVVEKNQTWPLKTLPKGKKNCWIHIGVYCQTQCRWFR
ncbi:unnamed protein product [Prunus armeniaca]